MAFEENLFWCLTKFRNLRFKSEPLNWVIQQLQVNFTLVSYWMKNIIFLDWTLFDAKDKVNPFVQVLGYVVAFESFSMFL